MNELADHYRQDDLDNQIHQALQSALQHQQEFDPNVIAAVDQFHIGGLQATQDMLHLAQFSSTDMVLDIGCGIGGPARNIAHACGAQVVGIDLSQDYCQAAQLISFQLSMLPQTQFIQANAVSLPFSDASYDAVWTQHVTMNIEQKDQWFSECSRVLKPQGQLLLYEVMLATENVEPSISYPLPWSVDGAHSYLQQADVYRQQIETNGLSIMEWNNVSDQAHNSVARLLKSLQSDKIKKPNLGLLLGDHYTHMMSNLGHCLEHHSLSVYQIKAIKD